MLSGDISKHNLLDGLKEKCMLQVIEKQTIYLYVFIC